MASGHVNTPGTLPWSPQRADVLLPQKSFSWAAMAAPSPMVQKQILGERLFPLIQRMYPDQAGKITGMLLEMDNKELLLLLESQESLKAKAKEAAVVVQAHRAKEQIARVRQDEVFSRHESLNADILAAAPPQEQKQLLGERLFPLIQRMYPELAGKITGMLLEIDNKELLHMLESQEALTIKVEETVAVLQAHQAKKQAAVTGKKDTVTPLRRRGVRQDEVISGHEPLTADIMAAFPPQHQKLLLGERLLPLIQRMYPELAGKITGMLLEIDNKELLHMLESQEALKAKVEEAVAVLQAHQAKEQAAVTGKKDTVTPLRRPGFRQDDVSPAGHEPLTADIFGADSSQQQKRLLGERLFPLIQNMYPDMAGQITGMLLEMDNKELLHMQDSQDILKAKVEEAAAILQAHNAKEQGAVTKQKDAVTQLPSPGVRQDEVISEHELEALTADTLAAVSPQQQKRLLGERLFPLIQRMYPELAGKITGMLLEMDPKKLLHMLESQEALKAKVEEAVAILQAHQAKEQAAVTLQKDAVKELPSPGVRQVEVISGHEPLTSDMLAAFPPHQQKQLLGERLFLLIQNMYPLLARKITGMLLEMNNKELLHMLQSQELLKAKAEEAAAVLQAHQDKKQGAVTEQKGTVIELPSLGVRQDENSLERREPLTADMLAAFSPQEQKQMLGGSLFPLVQRMYPNLAAQITGTLLEIDNSELLLMLESEQLLKTKVEEAVAALQARGIKESATAAATETKTEYVVLRPAFIQAIPILGQEGLVASRLVAAPLQGQKETLGMYLFPLVERMCTDRMLASTITAMLLERDIAQVYLMLQSQEVLVARVMETYAALQRHQTQTFFTAASALQTAVVSDACKQVVATLSDQEPLTADMLEVASFEKQKDMLRERLFPLIQRIYPDLAGKITSMLLEMDNKELLFLLKSQDSLKAKVEEAVAMLHADKAKEDDSIDEDDRQRSDLAVDEEEVQHDKETFDKDERHADGVVIDDDDDDDDDDEENRQRDEVAIEEERRQRSNEAADEDRKQRGDVVADEVGKQSNDVAVGERERLRDGAVVDEEKHRDAAVDEEMGQLDDFGIDAEKRQHEEPTFSDVERRRFNVAFGEEETKSYGAATDEKRQDYDVVVDDGKREGDDVGVTQGEAGSTQEGPVNLDTLDIFPLQVQKQTLIQRLFPLVQRMYPVLAQQIVAVLYELDNTELLRMLESQEALTANVLKAFTVLQSHHAD